MTATYRLTELLKPAMHVKACHEAHATQLAVHKRKRELWCWQNELTLVDDKDVVGEMPDDPKIYVWVSQASRRGYPPVGRARLTNVFRTKEIVRKTLRLRRRIAA